MHELSVKPLPSGDVGRLLVRLNHTYRDGVDRYGIAKITNEQNGKSPLVLMLGHDDDSRIYMPFDIRRALGVNPGAKRVSGPA